MARITIAKQKAVSLLLALVISSIALSSCGASAGSNAKTACGLVERSIHLFTQSESASSSTQVGLQTQALTLLRQALPYAAIAAGSNGQYQALQMTLSESSRVPEKRLIIALKSQCAPGASQLNEYIPPSTTAAG